MELTELEKLLKQRDELRAKQMESYHRNESRARRTNFNFKINDINDRIQAIRDADKKLTP
jgi:stalled ribosome alternative rescue factor ArfA